MKKPIITMTTDFGVQSQGIGIMEGVAYEINPEVKVIHFMHGLPDFNISYAARTMETLIYMPIGYHVCVVDPGVGTKRKSIIINTGRGDYLIGPDNGVLIPATRFLNGIKSVVEIINEEFMRKPVSPIFHGRDIFTPAAAYLSKGIKMEKFGEKLDTFSLAKAPYEEATIDDDKIRAKVISINKFGSLHLNITHQVWDKFNIKDKGELITYFKDEQLVLHFIKTFGEVEKGDPLIIKDDYGRIEVAVNQGSFRKEYNINIGDDFIFEK